MRELKIMNMQQVAFYVSKGVQPKRIEVGYNDKIVFIFDKDSTNALYTLWLENNRKYKANF